MIFFSMKSKEDQVIDLITKHRLWDVVETRLQERTQRLSPSEQTIAKINTDCQTLLGTKGFAASIGVCNSSITKYCQQGGGPIRQVKDLLQDVQAEHGTSIIRRIFDVLADGMGLCIVAAPSETMPESVGWLKLFAKIMNRFSSFSAEFSDAIRDEQIDREDLEALHHELKRTQRVVNDAVVMTEYHLSTS